MQAPRNMETLTVAVKPIEILDGYLETTISTGVVVAKDKSDLGFEFDGKLDTILVDRGDPIETAQPLAILNGDLLENQRELFQAQLANARALLSELESGPTKEVIDKARADAETLVPRLNMAVRQRERFEELAKQKSKSDQDFETALAEELSLKKQLEAANARHKELLAGTRQEKIDAQLAVVKQFVARANEVELKIDKSTLRAPYPAVVTARLVDQGAIVGPGQPVLQVTRRGYYEAQIGVTAAEAERFVIGSVHELQIGDTAVSGKVVSVLPLIDQDSRMATVVMAFETSVQPIIGRLALLEQKQKRTVSGFWLPMEGLSSGYRGLWSCFVVNQDEAGEWIVQTVDVDVLHVENQRAYVSGNVKPDELVVVSGINRIVAGQRVAVTVYE